MLSTVARDAVHLVFTVPVDAEYPLEQAPETHRHLEDRRNLGKVMLRPQA